MGIIKETLLRGIENPGLKSEDIVEILKKKYSKYDIINKSTANHLFIKMKRPTFHVDIKQKKGEHHLYVDSGMTILAIGPLGESHKLKAELVRQYLKKELSLINDT